MNRVFDYVCNQQEVNLKEIVIFMNQIGIKEHQMFKNFKDEDYHSIINTMMYAQRLERTQDDTFKAVSYNYPNALSSFKNDNSARIVFMETPCAHCSLADQCTASDPNAVVNPHRCLYMQQWSLMF